MLFKQKIVASIFSQGKRNKDAGGIQANKIFKAVHDFCRHCTNHDVN